MTAVLPETGTIPGVDFDADVACTAKDADSGLPLWCPAAATHLLRIRCSLATHHAPMCHPHAVQMLARWHSADWVLCGRCLDEHRYSEPLDVTVVPL